MGVQQSLWRWTKSTSAIDMRRVTADAGEPLPTTVRATDGPGFGESSVKIEFPAVAGFPDIPAFFWPPAL